MFSQQRVLGLGMVEALDDRLGRHSLPAAGVVACLTALGEASAMRIGVAIRTLAESDAGIARLAVRSGRMTFLAGDPGMRTGQGIAGLRVVELADVDGFPIVVGVALQTILSQPSFVLVLMTSHATCETPRKVLFGSVILMAARSDGEMCWALWQRLQASPACLPSRAYPVCLWSKVRMSHLMRGKSSPLCSEWQRTHSWLEPEFSL